MASAKQSTTTSAISAAATARRCRHVLLLVSLGFAVSAAQGQSAAAADAAPAGPPVNSAAAPIAKAETQALHAAASLALHWGDFAAAERLYNSARQAQRRTDTGELEASVLRRGFSEGLEPSNGLRVRQAEHSVAMTAQWVQQQPLSALAHGLHLMSLTKLGWAYRGGDTANTVAPQAWALFRAAIDRAMQHAANHAEVVVADSLGFHSMLVVARASDWDSRRTQSMYEQAIARFPEDDSLHYAQLTNVLPKWGGTARQVDQHIESVVKRTQSTQGLAWYALLYTSAANQQFKQTLFVDSMARWERVDKGFADLTARYPHAQYFNAWAWLACQAEDRSRLLELLAKLEPEPVLDQWGSNARQTYDTCKAWAQKL